MPLHDQGGSLEDGREGMDEREQREKDGQEGKIVICYFTTEPTIMACNSQFSVHYTRIVLSLLQATKVNG